MQKDIGSFVLSVLIGPVFGLVMSLHMMSLFPVEDATVCASNPSHFGCQLAFEFRLLVGLSVGALAATILLPLGYTIALFVLARKRTSLAYGFPILIRVCLLLLPLILVAHAALVGLVTWEAIQFRAIRPNLYIVGAILAVVGALLLAAFNILTGMRAMLAIEPVRATGVPLGESQLPEIHARVRRIAQKLGAVAPRHIAIGIEPTMFMTGTTVRLRGVGDMPEGDTLYVSTLALRTLDEAELEALLAFELSRFRGADLEFSRRFAPAQTALVNAVESVDEDAEESVFMKLAKTPAYGLLSLMLVILRWRMKPVIAAREAEADRAAREVTSVSKVMPMIVKMTVLGSQWAEFRAGLAELMNRGVGRHNIGADYLRRLRDYLGGVDPARLHVNLSAKSTPHPFDAHRTLAERATALGIDAKLLIPSTIAAIRAPAPADAVIDAIEAEVTKTDLDYTRVPGHPIKIADEQELPAELAHAQPAR